MIVQQNFLSKLRDFGLNSYESKLWTALLSRGSSTAGELSDIANVPRSRTYDVLESLEKKGFILRKLGKPIKYIAVPPEEVIDRVKDKVGKDAEIQLKIMEEVKTSDLLSELSALHAEGIGHISPADLSGLITGRENLYHHLESRLQKAKQAVSFIITSDGFRRKAEFLLPILKNLKKKGVAVRMLTHVKPEMKDFINQVSPYADVKDSKIRGRLCIIDSNECILMLLDDKIVNPSYDMAIWINTKFFAESLQKMFDEKWNA